MIMHDREILVQVDRISILVSQLTMADVHHKWNIVSMRQHLALRNNRTIKRIELNALDVSMHSSQTLRQVPQ